MMVNPTGLPSFPQPERGGKGGGDFLFKAPKGPLFCSPFPPLPPVGRLPRPRRSGFFLFASFSFIYGICIIYIIYVMWFI